MKEARLFCLVIVVLWLAAGVAWAQEYIVTSIEIKGNKHVNTESILAAVTATKIGEPFSEAKLQRDANAIAAMGYFEPEVQAYADLVEEGLRVVFEVIEYPVVEDITFSGNTLVSSEDLSAAMMLKPQRVFNARILNDDMKRLQNLYLRRGFRVFITDVKKKPAADPEKIILTAILVEAQVEAVEIIGLKKTDESVIRREIWTKPGDLFSERKILEDRRRLVNLGIFEEEGGVEASIREGSKLGMLVVVFDLTERKTGSLLLGLGYSSRDKAVGFVEARDSNFQGKLQKVNLKYEFGGIKSYELGFHEPWLDKKHTSFTFNWYNKWLNRFVASEFASLGQTENRNEHRKGASLTLTRPLNREETSSVWLTIRDETVEGRFTDPSVSILQPFYSQGEVASVTLRTLLDTSDYVIDPTRGWRNSFSVENAGGIWGGERDFTKYKLDLRHYIPSGERNVLALRTIFGTGVGDLPLFDAFTVGGAETLRGYAEDRFWGKKLLLMNLEYRIPLDKSEAKNLQGVLFLDYGDAWGGVWSTPDGSTVYPAEHQNCSPRLGYGVGLRMKSPIGIFRIDLGFSKEGQEPHFSIGHLF